MALNFLSNLFGGGAQTTSRGFGIDSFASEIGKSGIAKGQYFSVIISCNVPNADSTTMAAFPLRIESVNMPGRNLFTTEQNYYGPQRFVPYRASYIPVTLTIMMSEDMRERNFFMNWQDYIIGGNRVKGRNSQDEGSHDPYFYDDFIGTVEINYYAESPNAQGRGGSGGLLDTVKEVANIAGIDPSKFTAPFGFKLPFLSSENNNVKAVYKLKLNQAYPISVQDVPLSWGNDGHAQLQVEMRYYDIEEEYTGGGAAAKPGFLSQIRSAVSSIQKFAPVFSAVKNVGFKGTIKGAVSSVGSSISTQAKATRSILPF